MAQLFIDHIPGETRLAVLEDERLCALHIVRDHDLTDKTVLQGQIRRVRVTKVIPKMQAAFVDFGQKESGFLPVQNCFTDDISAAVQEGQSLIVQVKKQARDDKAALVSLRLELKSDDCILTPQAPGINLSKKIKDDAFRSALHERLSPNWPRDIGLVIRSSAAGKTVDAIHAQATGLLNTYQDLSKSSQNTLGLLYQSDNALQIALDQIKTEYQLDHIILEGTEIYSLIQSHFSEPQLYSDAKTPLFARFNIEEEIENALNPYVPLPNGGDIIIEPTTALISVDVNSRARQQRSDKGQSDLDLNKEAITTFLEQRSLRRLSGQIVIDCVRLRHEKAQKDLLQFCKTQCNGTNTRFHGVSRLGLYEFSHPFEGPSLQEQCGSNLYHFYSMIRAMKYQQGCVRLTLSSELFKIWQSEGAKQTRQWLFNRLGYHIQPDQDPQFPAPHFSIHPSKES